MVCAYSLSYLGAQEVKAAVSYDCATVLQTGQQNKTVSNKQQQQKVENLHKIKQM